MLSKHITSQKVETAQMLIADGNTVQPIGPMEHYSAIKRNERAPAWVNLRNISLSDTGQTQTTYWMTPLM